MGVLWSGARREGGGKPLPHGVTAYPLSFGSQGLFYSKPFHYPGLTFFFLKSTKKMPFSFPLYLTCEILRRSRGAQHQSTILTSLLCQGSPGTCRWHSGCCLYEAATQIRQEPATHLVPNLSRRRPAGLNGGIFALKSSRSCGTGRLEAPTAFY